MIGHCDPRSIAAFGSITPHTNLPCLLEIDIKERGHSKVSATNRFLALLITPALEKMRPQLLFVFIHFTILTTSSILATSQSPSLAEKPLKRVDNETIYKVSKQLCWGCLGESLQFLYHHNLVRAAKWELPLTWDFQLEKYASWWAGIRKADCKLQHSFPEYDFKLGENIYWGSGSTWTPTDAVSVWAGEEKYYDYAQNTCQEGQMCGHYTQIVWKTTRRIGCARVVCDDGDVFMTCNYDPPGNYVGERPY